MRDLLIFILLTGIAMWSIARPWIGAMLWTAVSLGSPHVAFGHAAANWPVSLLAAAVTLIGLLFTKERQNPFFHPAVVVLGMLVLWMCIGYPFSFAPDLCYNNFERTLKILGMVIITIALIDTRKKLTVFILVNVVSVGYYGVKGGAFSILTGGGHIVLGAGGFIAENNALALAEVVVLPLMNYMRLQTDKKWVQRAWLAAMVLTAASILGSQSRGALLGLVSIAAYFWLKSDKKFAWGLAIVAVGVFAVVAMPPEYWDRMNTIKTYSDDASAQGRINSWWAAFNIANDRITGGGFVTNIAWVYSIYAPNPRLLFVEHSIYFQMLGQFGWIGLIFFLTVGALTWWAAMRLNAIAKRRPDLVWAGQLGAMVQVSMIGYAVCGAFLSLALFDLPYNVMAIAVLGLRLAQKAEARPIGAGEGDAEPPKDQASLAPKGFGLNAQPLH